jgi:Stathmin family
MTFTSYSLSISFHLLLKAQRVEEVRKMSEQYSVDLKERIERKMETMGEKREAQLQSIQERIREHVRYINNYNVFGAEMRSYALFDVSVSSLSKCSTYNSQT